MTTSVKDAAVCIFRDILTSCITSKDKIVVTSETRMVS